MRIFVFVLLINLLWSFTGFGQEYWGKIDDLVGYDGELIPFDIYTFDSSDEALEAVEWILDYVGIPANFEIEAANVGNVVATIRGEQRYILYNQTWIKKVKSTAQNDWAATSILAHEIGHHFSGHTLQIGGSHPQLELEADKYSGFVLALMGASLEDAQKAIELLVTNEMGNRTHPPKSARLAAIASGWVKACEHVKSCEENAVIPDSVGTVSNPTSLNDSEPVIEDVAIAIPTQPIQATPKGTIKVTGSPDVGIKFSLSGIIVGVQNVRLLTKEGISY